MCASRPSRTNRRDKGLAEGERNEVKVVHPRQKIGEDPDLAWIKIIDEAIGRTFRTASAAYLKASRRDVLQANRLSTLNTNAEREISTMYPLATAMTDVADLGLLRSS